MCADVLHASLQVLQNDGILKWLNIPVWFWILSINGEMQKKKIEQFID